MKNDKGLEVNFAWAITLNDGSVVSMPYRSSDILRSSRITEDVKTLIQRCGFKGESVSDGNSTWTRIN